MKDVSTSLSQSANEEPNVIYTGVKVFVRKRRVSDTTPTVLLYHLVPDEPTTRDDHMCAPRKSDPDLWKGKVLKPSFPF